MSFFFLDAKNLMLHFFSMLPCFDTNLTLYALLMAYVRFDPGMSLHFLMLFLCLSLVVSVDVFLLLH